MRQMNGNLVAVIVTYNRLEKLKSTLQHTFQNNFLVGTLGSVQQQNVVSLVTRERL